MDSSSSRSLSNVPEEETPSRRKEVSRVPSSPYLAPSSASFPVPSNAASGSTRTARKPASVRTLGKSSTDQLATSGSIKRALSASSSSQAATAGSNGTHKTLKTSSSTPHVGSTVTQRYRANPRLPHDKDAEPAPSTIMHWSRAPVWGSLPMRSMRGHTVTLVDSMAWLIGGCDAEDSAKELYCFNTGITSLSFDFIYILIMTETMQWSLQDTVGDYPLPSRAHSATLIDRKIVIIGGGLGPVYYSTIHIFDTATRRWHDPVIAPGPNPAPRRAHSALFYKGRIWVFGGGNGLTALNDLWTLDIPSGMGLNSSRPMRWEEVQTTGPKPNPRGYHTANLIGNVMVVIGGSDSKECYTDVWSLDLGRILLSIPAALANFPLCLQTRLNGHPPSNQVS